MGCKAITHNYSVIVQHCSGVSSDFASAYCAAKAMYFVVISAGLARARNRPHLKARLPARLDRSLLMM